MRSNQSHLHPFKKNSRRRLLRTPIKIWQIKTLLPKKDHPPTQSLLLPLYVDGGDTTLRKSFFPCPWRIFWISRAAHLSNRGGGWVLSFRVPFVPKCQQGSILRPSPPLIDSLRNTSVFFATLQIVEHIEQRKTSCNPGFFSRLID